MRVCFGGTLYGNINTAVCLGNFDGIHIGHMEVLKVLINESRSRGFTSTLYNFTVHPDNVLQKHTPTPILTTIDKKIELLSKTALDFLYFDIFDFEYSRQSAEDFVKNIIVGRFGAMLVVVGEDYRFGYRAAGDVDYLRRSATKFGFELHTVSPVILNKQTVSSTYIRQLIQEGSVDNAAAYLGRHYSLSGKVVQGKGLGREIGYPTANIYPLKYAAIPEYGVYITKTGINGELHKSVSNIGIKPGFNSGMPVIETHIIDFNSDIYGIDIEIFFWEKIRDELSFDCPHDFKLQINKDVDNAKHYFEM